MTHYSQHAHLKYSATQLFDLVADVGSYPEFVPWVIAARIQRRQENTVWVDMTMGTSFLRRRFSTVAQLNRPRRIDISSHDPMFERFEQQWKFEPLDDGGTDVEYRVEYDFRSRLLQMLIGTTVAEQAETMVAAFRHRAQRLYGASLSASPARHDKPGIR